MVQGSSYLLDLRGLREVTVVSSQGSFGAFF